MGEINLIIFKLADRYAVAKACFENEKKPGDWWTL
jgi:hypothetical protein